MIVRRVVAALALLLALFSASFACQRVAERGRFATPYSSHSAGPDGLRALFRLTQDLGFTPATHHVELTGLEGAATLIAASGCGADQARRLSRPEREALQAWVSQGGLLIVMGVEAFVPKEIGLVLRGQRTCPSEDTLRPAVSPIAIDEPSPLSPEPDSDASSPEGAPDAGAYADESHAEESPVPELAEQSDGGTASQDATGEVLMSSLDEDDAASRIPEYLEAVAAGAPLAYLGVMPFEATRLVDASDEQATVLLDSELGPVAMTAPHGRGRVVLLGSATPFTNARLAYGGGALFARLLRAFAPQGPVLFDEYHVGMGERRSVIGYLRERGLGWDLLQLSMCVIMLLWARGARLGPPAVARAQPITGTRTFMSALGALFARTRDTEGALRILARHGLMRIAAQHRATGVALEELETWLIEQGLSAVASYAARVREAGSRPLAARETLQARAAELERDVRAALVIGVD